MELETLLAERAIYRQLVRFAQAMDERDWEAFEGLCSEDIVSDFGLGEKTGRDRLVEEMRRYLDVCGATQHLLGNVLIDVDAAGDRAKSRADVADLHLAPGDRDDTTFRTLGVYRDEWRKTAEGWRMCRRVKDNRAIVGSMDVFRPA